MSAAASLHVDLNCDMGEIPALFADGTQDRLMRLVSSVNIACGAHAGDLQLMEATIRSAIHNGVSIGAHPGYPDLANFGRLPMAMTPEEVATSVASQVIALDTLAQQCGATIRHVKPHGALYNIAAENDQVASAIAEGVGQWRRDVILVGLANSRMLSIFAQQGFATAPEAFADRQYNPNGTLRSRKFPDALVTDPAIAARQCVTIACHSYATAHDNATVAINASTICIHSDNPISVAIAEASVNALRAAGVTIRSLIA